MADAVAIARPAAAEPYPRRWLALGVLCFSLVVIVLDNTILNVAIPTIERELEATNSQLQWMVDSYTLVFAGLLLTAGALGDRFGRRGALQVGFVVFGVGSVLAALAQTPGQLIIMRAVMGIGGAFIMPATLSLITNIFPAHERARAISIWAAFAGVGVALGPLTGGFLLEHFYWGSIFAVNIPIVVAAAVVSRLVVPTSKDPSTPPLDPVGALLSIGGLLALVYAIIEAPETGWTSGAIMGPFAVAVALLVAFVAWERRVAYPMLDVNFFRNPRFTAASMAITLNFFALFGSTFLLTQYFQFVLGYSPLRAGVCLLPWAAVMMVCAPLSARLVERVGTKVVVSTGLVLVVSGLTLMTQLHTGSDYGDIVWRMMLMAAGMGFVMAPATESIMGSLPLAKAGVGSAVNDTTRQIGGALGIAIIGSVLSTTYGPKVDDAIAGRPVPPGVADGIKDSLGFALRAAAELGGPAGQELATAAKSAFVDGMHAGLLVGAAAALIGLVVTLIWLPARARTPSLGPEGAALGRDRTADGGHDADGRPDGVTTPDAIREQAPTR